MSSVTLGMTTKGINSTSRQISGGTTLDCKLKDPVCGLHKPVLKVQGLTKTYNNYNYAIWRGRYYWVDEILFLTNDIQEVHMHLDPLATFKGAIDETPAYLVYGDKAHCGGYVDDVRFGPEKKTKSVNFPVDIGFGITNPTFQEWTVILTASGSDPDATLTANSVSLYAMPESHFYTLLKDLYVTIDNAITDLSPLTAIGATFAEFLRFTSQGTPAENIRGAVAVPINYDKFYGTGNHRTEIYLGAYKCSCDCYEVSPRALITGDVTIDLQRPTFNQTYRFLNNSKYFSCKLVHPGGSIPLNVDACIAADEVYLHYSVSPVTGDYVVEITSGTSIDSNPIALAAGNLSFDMMFAIGNSKAAIQSIVERGIDIGAGIAKMLPNPVIQAAASVTESTTYTLDNDTGEMRSTTSITSHDTPYQTQNQTLSTSGIVGTFRPGMFGASTSSSSISGTIAAIGICNTPYYVNIALEYYYPQILDVTSNYEAYCNNYGYPINDYVASLNAVTGYAQCAGAFVRNCPGATTADLSTINSFLNNGIVLED